MTIAQTLEHYMAKQHVHYDTVRHPRTMSSMRTAQAANIPGDELAKAVILEDDDGYVMAVVPATHQVRLGILRRQLNRDLRFANEEEFAALFDDCDIGAIPPFGMLYGIPTVVDDSLMEFDDIYFEAGDHEELVHMSGDEFRQLLSAAQHGRFSRHM